MGQDREGDNGTGLHRIDWMAAAKRTDAETDAQMARATWPAAGEPMANPAHWSAPADSSGGRYTGDGLFPGAPAAPLTDDQMRAGVAALERLRAAGQSPEVTIADVTGCGDCPFLGEYGTDDGPVPECLCPGAPVQLDLDDYASEGHPSAPDWCPLRKSPLLVRLVPR